MKISLNIKSGTGGYFDVYECDKHIIDLEVSDVPKSGEKINLSFEGGELKSYMVIDVLRHFNIPKVDEGKWNYGEFVTVYVIPY